MKEFKTSDTLKFLIHTLIETASAYDDEQTKRLEALMLEIGLEIADRDKDYKVTNEPGEALERIKLRLFAKDTRIRVMELLKPR